MVNEFIVIAFSISSYVEKKTRNCIIIYIMGYFENFNHVTS